MHTRKEVMRTLILSIIASLSIGCGKPEFVETNKGIVQLKEVVKFAQHTSIEKGEKYYKLRGANNEYLGTVRKPEEIQKIEKYIK